MHFHDLLVYSISSVGSVLDAKPCAAHNHYHDKLCKSALQSEYKFLIDSLKVADKLLPQHTDEKRAGGLPSYLILNGNQLKFRISGLLEGVLVMVQLIWSISECDQLIMELHQGCTKEAEVTLCYGGL